MGPGAQASAMVPSVAHVGRRRRESPGVWSIDIEPPEPLAFAPGQFNMLTAFGVGEVPISLSGDPVRAERLVHTIRAVGPVSTALVELGRGAVLGLRGPFGRPWPLAEAEGLDVIVVAGGLGLAPLRPALYRLLAERDRYARVTLVYGARSPADALYARELERWRGDGRLDVELTVDHATSAWRGHVGVVTPLVGRAVRDPERAVALVCGPEVMMRFAVAELRDAGVADQAIHVSMERNMKCAVAWCGRCQLGTVLVCRDGPVFRYARLRELFGRKEI